jgi:hypothetical protein
MALQHIQLREKLRQSLAAQPTGGKAPTSALGRRLVQGPKPYAGPTSGLPEREQKIAGSRPSAIAGSQPKTPSLPTPTGGAPDYQQKAWDLRDKMVADRQAAADAGADEIYKRLLSLDEQGQQIVLDATRMSHPEYIQSMEEKGYISPEGVIAKAREEPRKAVSQFNDPQSGEIKVMYEDGTIEGTGMFAPLETEQPSTMDMLDVAIKTKELENLYTEEGKETVDEAYNIIGAPPQKYIADKKTGESVENPGYDEAYANWKNELYTEIARIKMLKGQAIDLNDLKLLYPNPEDIMFFQKNILGMENPTGEWSDETINLAIERLGGGAQ